ncbi:hypothetical protein ACFQXA_03835 [Nocardiopsis composta]
MELAAAWAEPGAPGEAPPYTHLTAPEGAEPVPGTPGSAASSRSPPGRRGRCARWASGCAQKRTAPSGGWAGWWWAAPAARRRRAPAGPGSRPRTPVRTVARRCGCAGTPPRAPATTSCSR